MNQAVSKKLLETNITFQDSLRTAIDINKRHISISDWTQIASHSDSSKWIEVPKENHEYLDTLVRKGATFAYASLLQACDRNKISWIHFCDKCPLIKGLPVFHDDWP